MKDSRSISQIGQNNQRLCPQHVKHALSYMHAHMSDRITLKGIAAACDVPERTLLRQFKRFVGVAPLAYLLRLRLNTAKNELASARNDAAISDIAMRCGFSHLGRFATDYRRLFSETPSATRIRARAKAVDSASAQSGPSHARDIVLGRLPARARATPSLLILPLGAETPEERLEARALTEQLLATLARMRIATVAVAHPARSLSINRPQPRNAGTDYCLLVRLTRRGERTRVVVRLVDVAADRHVWGDSFDGLANDPLGLQDRIVDDVLCSVVSHVTDTEIERANAKDPRDRAARDLALRALPHVLGASVDSAERAIAMLDPAIAMDPGDAVTTAMLAYCHAQRAGYHGVPSAVADWNCAQRLSLRAGLLDTSDPLVTIARGTVASFLGQAQEEDALVARALAMDPTSAWAWERRGYIRVREAHRLHSEAEADAAISDFDRGMRLRGPNMPQSNCLNGIAAAHHAAGRHQHAADWARRALAVNPGADWIHKMLSCTASKLGDKATVRQSVDCIRRARPHLTVSHIVEIWPQADTEWLEAISRAGMPL